MPFVESELRSSQKEDFTATSPELEAARIRKLIEHSSTAETGRFGGKIAELRGSGRSQHLTFSTEQSLRISG
jgi:hypothetical protein